MLPTPPPTPPVPPASAGAKLVSTIQRSGYDFFPHPIKTNTDTETDTQGGAGAGGGDAVAGGVGAEGAGPGPYTGPLRLGAADGPGALCITKANASSPALTLELCSADTSTEVHREQQWRVGRFDIAKQAIIHNASGMCLDVAGAAATGDSGRRQ